MAIVYALIPLLILLIPLLIIAWLKLRRRKRRRRSQTPSTQVSGGWAEVMSYATDLGAEPVRSGTRKEHAGALSSTFPAATGTTLLAQRADAAVFGPQEPTEAQVADYWAMVDSQLQDMRGSVSGWKRLRAKYSPRSLMVEAKHRRQVAQARRRRERLAARQDRAAAREERRALERAARSSRRGGGSAQVRTVDQQATDTATGSGPPDQN